MTRYGDLSKEEILFKVIEDYAALQRQTELIKVRYQQHENCMLVLGCALLRLKHEFHMSWEQIASLVDGISDKSLAHRIVKREKGVSKRAYELARESINKLLEASGKQPIDFPEYPSHLR